MVTAGTFDDDSVESLAERVGIGSRHLHRLFVQHVGTSPVVVGRLRRLEAARRLVGETDLPMTVVAISSGFGSVRRFNDAFRKGYGRSPRESRSQYRLGRDMRAAAVELELAFGGPYAWENMLSFLRQRAVEGVERVHGSSYARTIETGGGPAIVTVRPIPGASAMRVVVHGAEPEALLQIAMSVRRVFDLSGDRSSITDALTDDPLLAACSRVSRGLRIPGAWEAFESAVRSILGETLAPSCAAAAIARVVDRAGRRIRPGVEGFTHLFPSAADLAAASLDGLGLPDHSVIAIPALARAVLDGTLDFAAAPLHVRKTVGELPGCGPAIAEMVALRGLGDPDAFPVCDALVRAALGSRAITVSPAGLAERAETWRPWRGYAAMLFAYAAGDACARTSRTPAHRSA
jgi:AraC family transcriptional regulator of adaptative response / DNA-3-methyladenine glycosylase II